jgi:ADP-ribose pyrophosphatase YjhB (NUDIX family)
VPDVRPIAIAVIRHPATRALLVQEGVGPESGRIFHRPPGGGIEFQELACDTIARELDEEFGLGVRVGSRIGILENLFVYGGRPGHEIVLVHEAEVIDLLPATSNDGNR